MTSSADTDLEKKIEDEDNCYESVTEENKIRAELAADTKNPDLYMVLYLSPNSFKIPLKCLFI